MLPTVIVFGHSVDLQHINKYRYNQQTCFSCMGLYGPSTMPQMRIYIHMEKLRSLISWIDSYMNF
jgi:hypothetical protein